MKPSFSVLTVIAALLLAPAAQAATYQIDPSHTRVIYFISHLSFSNFMGHFNKVSGTIDFNPNKPEAATVTASIDATSVSMDETTLDPLLQKQDFFNTAKYPSIDFKSTEIKKTGADTGKMTGNVTLLGITKPVTLDVKFNHKGFNQFAKAAAVGFTATGKIRRSDFGMKAYLPVVGDEVTLRIEVEAHANSAAVEK